MRDTMIEKAYGGAWKLVRMMPESMAERVFRLVADHLTRRDGIGVRRLRANLRRVLPDVSESELDGVVAEGMRSYCRYWMEAFRLPTYSREDLIDRFVLENYEVFDKHRADGIGVIIALPHSGNWDIAGAWAAAMGYPLSTVAERLKPEGVYQQFLDFRRSLGMEILPHSGGERPVLDVLAQRLKEGYVVPLMSDRDLSRRGVPVTLFGEQTRMPSGPAQLAIRTGAPIYTTVLRNTGDRTSYGMLKGPLRVPTGGSMLERVSMITQDMASAFEKDLAIQPADWHMLQPLWLSDTKQRI